MDVLLVNPNSSRIYQDLAKVYSAIEPPTWSLLLAGGLRKEFGVGILDCDAERLTDEQAAIRVKELNPRLVCFVVYGQNPNSGTTNMSGAISLAKKIKEYSGHKISFVGSHTSALPSEVLSYKVVDFVLVGDGLYALRDLLKTDLKNNLSRIGGLGWKNDLGMQLNGNGKVVPQDRLDYDLPRYAWDLLPYKDKPLDLYRSHFWHTNYIHEKRSPFATIYTSLGCSMKCQYCMINIINKNQLDDSVSDQYNKMKFWSTDHMLNVLEDLVINYNIETVRIADELFFFNRRYYEPFLDGIIQRGLKINTWSYTRIDTVRPQYLEKFKKAGVNWLGIGIEAANQLIRREISKGSFEDIDIREICRTIREAGISVGANYIFGFPNEKMEDLQATLGLALELNTEFANFYTATALPGSPLYMEARQKGWDLPDSFEGYGFLAEEYKPLPTNFLSAKEVLVFRDRAWHTYFKNTNYLNMIENKFGLKVRQNIEEQTKIKLRRKYGV